MKKKVYLVQVNVTYSDKISYIPYAAGCVAAYALNDAEITKSYEICDILFLRKTTQESLADIVDPYMVGFSCYSMFHV